VLPSEDAARDAFASLMLRRKHQIDEDIARHRAAESFDVAAIRARYDRLAEPLDRMGASIARVLTDLAASARFVGKAKSRKLGWGILGRRKERDAVEITDDQETVGAMARYRPEAVVVSFSCALSEVDQYLIPRAMPLASFTVAKSLVKAALADKLPIAGAALHTGEDVPYFEVQSPLVPTD
jgi:hypothetical protein